MIVEEKIQGSSEYMHSRLITIFVMIVLTINFAYADNDFSDHPQPNTPYSTTQLEMYDGFTDQQLAEAIAAQDTYGYSLCQMPGYKCKRVHKNDTWHKLWPYAHDRYIEMRINRTNVALKYRKWVIVVKHLHKIKYEDLSPLPKHIIAMGQKLIYVDLKLFAFGAYDEQGNLVYWGPASGGRAWCDDLNISCISAAGSYHIYRIQGADCVSTEFPYVSKGGAPMPYCMHYYKGFAIHGSTLAGFVNLSRGCVRLFYDDAQWLNEHFATKGTRVLVVR